MSFGKLARKIWHDCYYAVGGKTAERLALTCREATDKTNHGDLKGFRYWLHISVCQACKNYYSFSAFLRRQGPRFRVSAAEITQLNKRLLKRFTSGNS